jgi:chromosome segregation ATPase
MAYIEQELAELKEMVRELIGKVNQVLGKALGEARRDAMARKTLEKIVAEVEEIEDAVEATERTYQALAEEIRNLGGDEEKEQELADKLDGLGRRLAEASVANTPHRPSGE